MNKFLSVTALAASLAFAVPALAQNPSGAQGGAAGGAAAGAVGGALVGGPVGAAVGAVVGGAAGAMTGSAFTPEDRTYVREYVARERVPSVRYEREVAVGQRLPDTIEYRRISGNPRFESYRYARVNDRYVMVDRDGTIVQIID